MSLSTDQIASAQAAADAQVAAAHLAEDTQVAAAHAAADAQVSAAVLGVANNITPQEATDAQILADASAASAQIAASAQAASAYIAAAEAAAAAQIAATAAAIEAGVPTDVQAATTATITAIQAAAAAHVTADQANANSQVNSIQSAATAADTAIQGGTNSEAITIQDSYEVDAASIQAEYNLYVANDPSRISACFTPGTLISTPTGSTPVQDLRIGDLILNHLGQPVPVKWIGTQRFHPAFAGDKLPICIRQGALGNDLPLRDLYVPPPGHALYIDNCLLIDAKALVNGTTITQVTQWEGDVQYLYIETVHHEIILAEGTPAETFMDNVSRTCFNNYSDYESLYPQATEMIELDIPRVSHKRQLPNAVRAKLEAISEVLMESRGVKERMVG